MILAAASSLPERGRSIRQSPGDDASPAQRNLCDVTAAFVRAGALRTISDSELAWVRELVARGQWRLRERERFGLRSTPYPCPSEAPASAEVEIAARPRERYPVRSAPLACEIVVRGALVPHGSAQVGLRIPARPANLVKRLGGLLLIRNASAYRVDPIVRGVPLGGIPPGATGALFVGERLVDPCGGAGVWRVYLDLVDDARAPRAVFIR